MLITIWNCGPAARGTDIDLKDEIRRTAFASADLLGGIPETGIAVCLGDAWDGRGIPGTLHIIVDAWESTAAFDRPQQQEFAGRLLAAAKTLYPQQAICVGFRPPLVTRIDVQVFASATEAAPAVAE